MGRNAVALVALCAAVALLVGGARSQPLVRAIMTFGDSTVDVGNNNYLATVFKANYPPYGRDFAGKKATGRFCNGKLATDFTAELLGFTEFQPAYLSPEASGRNLLIGANFASAGSGYYDKTALLSNVIPLSLQLEYYKQYQQKLSSVAGSSAASIISNAIHVISTGSSDFLQNYYVNPLLNKLYTADQFSTLLVGIFGDVVKELYSLGARKIGVSSLPPLGCVPAAITLFGMGSNECVARLNADAQGFNAKLRAAVASLPRQYPGLKLVEFDVYKPLLDLVRKPSDLGFAEARRGCCGTGLVETTVLLCNPKSLGTCANATQYVFFDGVHPSEAANQILSESLIEAGISLI